MAKYIDAEALAKRFWEDQYYSAESILQKIGSARDVDAVKIVRCEDCRFWEPENAEEGDTYGRCMIGNSQARMTDMTWFCADGERVEE